jgi:diketogulonate reductase-like aldo/keto reductase
MAWDRQRTKSIHAKFLRRQRHRPRSVQSFNQRGTIKGWKLVAIAKNYLTARVELASPENRSSLLRRFSHRRQSKSTAQILYPQHGAVVITKSANRARILENADVFDFEISAAKRELPQARY